VDIPAVHTEPVQIAAATIQGQAIPAVTIPGVDIPAQRIPAQCVQISSAPGGCLGAVSIPPVAIPPVTIPAVEIPAVQAGGINLPPKRAEAVTSQGASAAGDSETEVCQIKAEAADGYVPSVYRPSVYRQRLYRAVAYRPSVSRPSTCNDKNECVPEATVPAVSVPGVTVPGVGVPGAGLKGRTVGKSQVFEGKDSIAYNIGADVLFDFDRAEIRPSAVAELRRIAKAIEEDVPTGAPVQVDGHADAKGDDAFNQRLSEQRAQAVVEWLVAEGHIDRGRLRATGYGETKPVAANTRPDGADDPKGRAKNRRVVISAPRK
jgi:outer membrane protein OmpA-like peptidoglycan-associated protein